MENQQHNVSTIKAIQNRLKEGYTIQATLSPHFKPIWVPYLVGKSSTYTSTIGAVDSTKITPKVFTAENYPFQPGDVVTIIGGYSQTTVLAKLGPAQTNISLRDLTNITVL